MNGIDTLTLVRLAELEDKERKAELTEEEAYELNAIYYRMDAAKQEEEEETYRQDWHKQRQEFE